MNMPAIRLPEVVTADNFSFLFPSFFSSLLTSLQVAQVCVESLVEPAAADKVVEIIAEEGATPAPLADLFASVN
jgi:hypothetical protein